MKHSEEIEKTLNSLDGLQKAEMHPFLYEKIRHRMQNKGQSYYIPSRYSWKLASVVIVVLAMNIITWTRSSSNEKSTEQKKNPIAQEYFSYLNSNQF